MDGNIIGASGHARVADLDVLPLPLRGLLDNSLYRSPETGNPLTIISGNRGCPSKCIFCPAGVVSGYKLRLRSPQSILAELHDCVEIHGIHEFLFNGDTFTMNKRWLLELCNGITSADFKIHWGCNSRVDTMDAERAQALKKAGCWVVAFGIESGDQGMLDYMKKGTKVEDAERAVAICKAAGLAVHTFFIIGLPWETEATLEKTYQFIKKLNPDFFDINIAFPLPGTELYDIATTEGLITSPEGEGSYAVSAVRSRALSAERLTEWRKKTLLRLYARPGYVARTLWRALKSGTLKHYVRAAMTRAKGLLAIK
ncbi:TPA: hypothetical protein DDW35_12475 [Candidatus Sumerlaeota bacterium]|nr:hypothetical protein [Candidatus Sumerlaeota bacterium]